MFGVASRTTSQAPFGAAGAVLQEVVRGGSEGIRVGVGVKWRTTDYYQPPIGFRAGWVGRV